MPPLTTPFYTHITLYVVFRVHPPGFVSPIQTPNVKWSMTWPTSEFCTQKHNHEESIIILDNVNFKECQLLYINLLSIFLYLVTWHKLQVIVCHVTFGAFEDTLPLLSGCIYHTKSIILPYIEFLTNTLNINPLWLIWILLP